MAVLTKLDHLEAIADGELPMSVAGKQLLSSEKYYEPVSSALPIDQQLELLSASYQTLRTAASKHYRDSNGGGSPFDPSFKEKNAELEPLCAVLYGPEAALNSILGFTQRLDKLREAVNLLNNEGARFPTQASRQLERLMPQALDGWTTKTYQEMADFVDSWQKDIGSVLKSQGDALDATTKDYLQDAAEIADITAGKIAELQRQQAQAQSSHIA